MSDQEADTWVQWQVFWSVSKQYDANISSPIPGENGVSHGIELHSNIIDHARESIHLFSSQKYIAGFDWCRPQYDFCDEFSSSHKYSNLEIQVCPR